MSPLLESNSDNKCNVAAKHNINYTHKSVRPHSDIVLGIIIMDQGWAGDHGNTINVSSIFVCVGRVHAGIGV